MRDSHKSHYRLENALNCVCCLLIAFPRSRPLSRRIPPPQPAGTLPRRRRRKKFSAPPRQPKFTDAAAAAIFAARRGASDFNSM